ncbi:unnamed protein product [Fusarium venenatum]|uniref:Uncharacterized protein n=1 Tax=Fusarium venenatum TaxID=56646 RepID=A0A2L2TCL0_9HYPO|nr:uncharacterized protein FVRRES_02265 [Fusarium venenatum]CEI65753.1 unnamed protein product [Fusarium venenatum]
MHSSPAQAQLQTLLGYRSTNELDPVLPSRQPQPYPIAYYATSVELRASRMKRLSVISTILQPEPITQALGNFDISPGNTPMLCLEVLTSNLHLL